MQKNIDIYEHLFYQNVNRCKKSMLQNNITNFRITMKFDNESSHLERLNGARTRSYYFERCNFWTFDTNLIVNYDKIDTL